MRSRCFPLAQLRLGRILLYRSLLCYCGQFGYGYMHRIWTENIYKDILHLWRVVFCVLLYKWGRFRPVTLACVTLVVVLRCARDCLWTMIVVFELLCFFKFRSLLSSVSRSRLCSQGIQVISKQNETKQKQKKRIKPDWPIDWFCYFKGKSGILVHSTGHFSYY